MRATASLGTAARPESTETLSCPECGQPNAVPVPELIEGTEIHCRHCPAELVVGRVWDENGDTRAHWVLANAPEDDVDEER